MLAQTNNLLKKSMTKKILARIKKNIFFVRISVNFLNYFTSVTFARQISVKMLIQNENKIFKSTFKHVTYPCSVPQDLPYQPSYTPIGCGLSSGSFLQYVVQYNVVGIGSEILNYSTLDTFLCLVAQKCNFAVKLKIFRA